MKFYKMFFWLELASIAGLSLCLYLEQTHGAQLAFAPQVFACLMVGFGVALIIAILENL
jgi:hypothetical protein